jgi:uridylate kinase
MDADVICLKKKVDGVYDSDPNINSSATKFDYINYLDVINKGLGVMDSTATSLAWITQYLFWFLGLTIPKI